MKTKKSETKEVTPSKDVPMKPEAEEAKNIQIIERVIENREIAPQDAFGKLNRTQIDLMKRTIAKGASDDELTMFIQVCKGANLNPFLKQVFLVPRWDNKEGREVRAIQVSIDGFRAIAESGGQYAGNDDPVFEGEEAVTLGSKKQLTHPNKATVTVFKIIDGQRYPFSATARWSEYYPGEKMGFQWHSRPFLMLGKCAEALALRKAFPKLLSGMYAQEEMEKGSTAVSDGQKVQTGFHKLMKILETATIAQIEDYKVKIEKSDKYTAIQKAEFLAGANDRLEQIAGGAA